MSHFNQLENKLLSCLTQDRLTDHAFDDLAIQIFEKQHQHNVPYQNYCQARGASPETVRHWHDIPALPTDAFKFAKFPVISFPLEQKQHTFLTSGTTTEQKGEHHFPSLLLYEESIRNAWPMLGLPQAACAVFLTPTPRQAPHSSLSHMMGVLEPIVAEHSMWLDPSAGALNAESIGSLVDDGKPLALLGTALSFLDLFEHLNEPLILPPASYAMETGGYKGTHRQLEKRDLYALFQEKLGLTNDAVINEYSMTEISSQFYTRGIGATHQAPPWTRIRVIDPLTGTEAANGSPGYLVIYDLANLHSTMAVQTQDIAVAQDNRSFTLLGRDPSALPRGCSRSADTHMPSP